MIHLGFYVKKKMKILCVESRGCLGVLSLYIEKVSQINGLLKKLQIRRGGDRHNT